MINLQGKYTHRYRYVNLQGDSLDPFEVEMKRSKQLIIRVSIDEYHALLSHKTRACLATWMREICLGVKQVKPPLKVEPELLISLAKIGGNLNQIAKYVNQNRKSMSHSQLNTNNSQSLIDHIRIINELSLIREDLNMLLEWHMSMGQLDASEDI